MTAKNVVFETIKNSPVALDCNEIGVKAHIKLGTVVSAASDLFKEGKVLGKQRGLGNGRSMRVYYVRPEQIANMHGLGETERLSRKNRVAKGPKPATQPVEMLLSVRAGNETLALTIEDARALFLSLKQIFEPVR